MAPIDEQDPVLIPSLPDPWEGLVSKAIALGREEGVACHNPLLSHDDAVQAIHAASRAEKALRVALRELLGVGNSDP